MATNLFGRGMDIERVNIVFNYDMPEDSDTYLHQVFVYVVVRARWHAVGCAGWPFWHEGIGDHLHLWREQRQNPQRCQKPLSGEHQWAAWRRRDIDLHGGALSGPFLCFILAIITCINKCFTYCRTRWRPWNIWNVNLHHWMRPLEMICTNIVPMIA